MSAFSERISRNVLLFDGSMGALIGQMGINTTCPDELSILQSDVIRGIHKRYLEAGANVIVAGSAVFKAVDRATIIEKLKA